MRDIPVANGRLHVNFDDKYQIRDFYFPHVGQENHTEGFPFRFGVWVDDRFSWTSSEGWHIELKYLPDTLVTEVKLANAELSLSLVSNDCVASHDNVFVRRLTVHNSAGREREVRIFFHHDLRIYENKVGDTAFYDPETLSLIHYKKHRYFLINTLPHFDQFVTGRKAFRHNEGTWRDAEDGWLGGNVTTEGSVDSTVAVHLNVPADHTSELFYWIAAGTSHSEVARLNTKVIVQGAGTFIDSTASESHAWVNNRSHELKGLPDELAAFYKRSLLTINTQIDRGGAILAANDHDVTERATDHYSYLWMRDGALIANALDRAGYGELTRRFFEFCCNVVHDHGYFLQKYNPDGTVASGWHPSWDRVTKSPMVPIQEDETALVLWAFWEHYLQHRDIDFALRTYRSMIVKAADFMVAFRDPRSGLPQPSWNLWEDRRGVHTFTCSTVVAGLRAAANFSELFGEVSKAEEYRSAANDMVEAMRRELYSVEHRRFLRGLLANGDDPLTPDAIIDASLFATFYFGAFAPEDPLVTATMDSVVGILTNAGGGVARFENDPYMRESEGIAGNSWFICTLWVAEYHIARAKSIEELKAALDILNWVATHALPSGVLAEQFDPVTRKHLSVSPLTWSHSSFISATHSYLAKKRALGS